MASPFSLLLPVYGRDDPAHLRRAFVSAVDDQTLPPSQIVVVQDGPVPAALSDAIESLVTGAAIPIQVVRLPSNSGLAAALTAGLAACEYEIVARMDADDIAVPERFAAQLAAIDTGLDMVGSALAEFVDDETAIVGVRTPPLTQPEIVAYAHFHSPFNHPTVVFRRAAVLRAGGYLDVGPMEDYWLWIRMLVAGARVANLPEPLLKYRIGAGAYGRRGGLAQLRTEIRLQRLIRSTGFTTALQSVRNILVRGAYRLLPEAVRRTSYRAVLQRGFTRTPPAT